MAAHDALGRQFGEFVPPTSHADSWYPNESDEFGSFVDRDEASRAVRKSKPILLPRGRELN